MMDSIPKDSTEENKLGTVCGGYVRAIANTLEHKGIDSEPILRAAGIEQLPTNDPMERVSALTITRLFKESPVIRILVCPFRSFYRLPICMS